MVQIWPWGCGFEHPIADPLFSNICMYRSCSFGTVNCHTSEEDGAAFVAARAESGELGARCAAYISAHVLMIGTISDGGRSARVRLCLDEKVRT